MSSLLQQLENNEAVLLMYLADELPADDRAEVEHMLANDAKLRAELEQLRVVQQSVMLGLRDLDRAAAPAVSEAVAVRQISRLMKQWQVDRLSRPTVVASRRKRLPWWLYSSATAAAVLVGLVVWWGMKTDDHRDVADTSQPSSSQPAQYAFEDDPAFRVVQSLMTPDNTTPGIADAEQEVSTISNRSDDASILMFEPAGSGSANQ